MMDWLRVAPSMVIFNVWGLSMKAPTLTMVELNPSNHWIQGFGNLSPGGAGSEVLTLSVH